MGRARQVRGSRCLSLISGGLCRASRDDRPHPAAVALPAAAGPLLLQPVWEPARSSPPQLLHAVPQRSRRTHCCCTACSPHAVPPDVPPAGPTWWRRGAWKSLWFSSPLCWGRRPMSRMRTSGWRPCGCGACGACLRRACGCMRADPAPALRCTFACLACRGKMVEALHSYMPPEASGGWAGMFPAAARQPRETPMGSSTALVSWALSPACCPFLINPRTSLVGAIHTDVLQIGSGTASPPLLPRWPCCSRCTRWSSSTSCAGEPPRGVLGPPTCVVVTKADAAQTWGTHSRAAAAR